MRFTIVSLIFLFGFIAFANGQSLDDPKFQYDSPLLIPPKNPTTIYLGMSLLPEEPVVANKKNETKAPIVGKAVVFDEFTTVLSDSENERKKREAFKRDSLEKIKRSKLFLPIKEDNSSINADKK